jgi:hypothetical protein
MNGNFLKIRDLVSLNLADASTKDNLYGAPQMQQTGKGLLVKLAATHAGIITRNNMLYLPDKMRDSAKTFVTPFQKPMIVNHNDEGSPIGRIVAATYVDTSSFVKDKYRGKKLKDSLEVTDALIDRFCNGSMSYGQQVDFLRTYLKDSILDDPEYTGLGYIEVTAHITDKDAIQKFLDGRYLTSSVGAGTNRASCSVCKQDWTKDGMCDHRPGKIYDGTKCYVIAGEFEYEELSMVNKPADRHSKVLSLSYNGAIHDSVVEDTEFSGKLYEVRVQFLKEEDMKIKDSETTDTTTQQTETVNDQLPAGTFDEFIGKVLLAETGELTDAEDERLYGLMLDEMKASGLFTDKQIEDSKLSPEKRKALSKVTFGVANRAFPLTDHLHLVATKRILDKYKGNVATTSVLEVVDRKAKVLGVALDKLQADPTPAAEPVQEVAALDKLTVDEFKKHFTLVVDLAKKNHAGLLKDLLSSTEKALLDEFAALETLAGGLRDEVKKVTDKVTELTASNAALKQEYEIATKEAEVLQDEVVRTKASLRNSKEKNLVLYKSLKTGTIVEPVDATVTDSVIDSELETLVKEVDMKKITDKLNDGTSRKPSGTVDNPTEIQDNKVVDAATVRGKLAQIEANYMQMKFKNSVAAEQYLAVEMNRLKAEGLIPKDSE